MKIFSLLFLLLLVIFGITFSILNSDAVILNYYFGQYEIKLSFLLVFTLVIGALLGFAMVTPSMFRAKRQNAKLKSRIKKAEQEVDNLRSIPIRNTH